MKIDRLSTAETVALGGPVATAEHVRGLVAGGESVEREVRQIVAEVRAGGDRAVLDCTRRFDTAGAEPQSLTVAQQELDAALKELDLGLVASLQVAVSNVALVAQAGVGEDVAVELPQGQRVALREVPVQAAAVYVPGGRAPYPSTVVMGVVTARAAGVLDVAVCSPPAGPSGEIDPVILGACRLCGVETVYRMGGAQAIAALAYGTESVRRVDVVVGPGNLYVQEAKRLLSGVVGIDGFAGPSDLMVVLGAGAGPREVELAALDMLGQAEHGAGSLVVGTSPSPDTLDALAAELERLQAEQPRASVKDAVCLLAGAADARAAIELANAIAPEHLQLIGADVEPLTGIVRCAGCLFVGSGAGTAFGDYVAGSNHVLPTGGSARFASTLSSRHFRRRMSEVRLGPPGGETARKLAAAGIPLAEAEGFAWHAESMRARAYGQVAEGPVAGDA
jgi:histidinol dehydrogenase